MRKTEIYDFRKLGDFQKWQVIGLVHQDSKTKALEKENDRPIKVEITYDYNEDDSVREARAFFYEYKRMLKTVERLLERPELFYTSYKKDYTTYKEVFEKHNKELKKFLKKEIKKYEKIVEKYELE